MQLVDMWTKCNQSELDKVGEYISMVKVMGNLHGQ